MRVVGPECACGYINSSISIGFVAPNFGKISMYSNSLDLRGTDVFVCVIIGVLEISHNGEVDGAQRHTATCRRGAGNETDQLETHATLCDIP